MKRIAFVLIILYAAIIGGHAQRSCYSKMSPLVRHAVSSAKAAKNVVGKNQSSRSITAFVRVNGNGEAVLIENGCKVLAQFGDIYIASIPLNMLRSLADIESVERIEAGESCSLLMDKTNPIVGVDKLHIGEGLPQAFTGKGVVMGMQDIGFDLTHPNFYDVSMSGTRIKRFWDQLSIDTIGSNMYVGAEYTTSEDMLKYAHSRDGLIQCHGNHTLGIAAGTGYDTPYRGIAYESDICLVSNAVTSDTVFISDDDLFKYTSATDVLGFKYIFDYADEVGRPCVISFSEGSHQDFYGDDKLMYEALQSMVGPGRIIVAAAGNEGYLKSYFRKNANRESMGSFIIGSNKYVCFRMKADAPFVIKLTVYNDKNEIYNVELDTKKIISAPDFFFTETISIFGKEYVIEIEGYDSCYDEQQMVYDLYVESSDNFGWRDAVSLEVVGKDADVEVYRVVGYLIENSLNSALKAGDSTHTVYSPGSAPSVICVGATTYVDSFYNENGQLMENDWGQEGERAMFSGIGPTFDDRVKPDVMAPGNNIVSSYSSYFMENNPYKEVDWRITHSKYNGRVYPWNSNCGTSMSTPIVGGSIALWLQAVPTLSPEDIIGVFKRTCNKYDMTLEYPNNYYGYGEIDVYRGLLDILGLASIEEISSEIPKTVNIRYVNNTLSLDFICPPANPFTVSVYSTSGILVMQQESSASSDNYSIDLSSLPKGIYAIQLSGSDKGITGSTLIRRI